MSPVGRGCWELGSFDLRVRAKVQVGRLRVAELSPRGCATSSWVLFVRHVGRTRVMVPISGCASKHLRGLPKVQVSGPHSRQGLVGIWAFHTFPAAAVKPGWQWPGGHFRGSL